MTKAISEVITDRLKKAGKRFHANDNISDYINDKERDLLVDETQDKFEQVLKSLVIDIETDPNSNGTARRLASGISSPHSSHSSALGIAACSASLLRTLATAFILL